MFRRREAIRNARNLRRRETEFEKRLWAQLRSRRFEGVKFRRQHPIDRYIVDFCAPSVRLVIEVDGGQHAERGEQDEIRSRRLESLGYRVLRFWNPDVSRQLESVLEEIQRAVRIVRS